MRQLDPLFRYIPRSLLFIAFVLSLAISWLGTTLYEEYCSRASRVMLELDLETETPCNWELFWNTGKGWVAGQSSRFATNQPNKRAKCRFRIPKFTSIEGLRLDPLDRKGTVRIYGIQLVNGLLDPVPLEDARWDLEILQGVDSFSSKGGVFEIKSNSNDPALLLKTNYDELNHAIALQNHFHPVSNGILLLSIFAVVFLLVLLLRVWSVPLLVASIFWIVFYPGVFSPDSFAHILEAETGRLMNWHPPIMPIILRLAFRLGISVEWVIYIQIVLGNYLLLWFFYELVKRISKRADILLKNRDFFILTLVLFVILYSPLTPLSGFAIALWKDTWFTFSLLGVLAFAFAMQRRRNLEKPTVFSRGLNWCLLFVLLYCMTQSLCLRKNAVVLVPVFVALIWILVPSLKIWLRTVICFGGVVLFLKSNDWLADAYHVKDTNPRSSVMSLEMAGLLKLYPEFSDEFPYVANMLKEGWQDEFEWANYRKLRWGMEQYVDATLVKVGPHPELDEHYFRAVKSHPFAMIHVKWMNFIQLLNPMEATEWYPAAVALNDKNLRMNIYAKNVYHTYWNWTYSVQKNGFLRWFSAVNLLWVLVGTGLLGMALKSLVSRSTDRFFDLLVIAIPLIYAGSYFLATPWKAFRYLYPSTLIIQVFVLAMLFVKVFQWFQTFSSENTQEAFRANDEV